MKRIGTVCLLLALTGLGCTPTWPLRVQQDQQKVPQTQLVPSASYPIRAQLRWVVNQALID